jgi:hypothetical protein
MMHAEPNLRERPTIKCMLNAKISVREIGQKMHWCIDGYQHWPLGRMRQLKTTQLQEGKP